MTDDGARGRARHHRALARQGQARDRPAAEGLRTETERTDDPASALPSPSACARPGSTRPRSRTGSRPCRTATGRLRRAIAGAIRNSGTAPTICSGACRRSRQRSDAEAAAAEAILRVARDAARAISRARMARRLYDLLTRNRTRFVRLEAARVRSRGRRARPGADARTGRGRKRARCSATRTASRSTRAFSSRTCSRASAPAATSATPCCCRARRRPSCWRSSRPTARSTSARSRSSARARRRS